MKGDTSLAFDNANLASASYYAIDLDDLERVDYDDLCIPARTDAFVMKPLDDPELSKLHEAGLTEDQSKYRQGGYLIKRKFIPERIIDDYLDLRERLGLGLSEFSNVTPFVEHKEVRKLTCYRPLMDLMSELHSCQIGAIFTLTKFQSTQRGWHSDAYLDREDAVPRVAVWIALGEVTDDSGPFEYIPGSHRWAALSNLKINRYLKEDFRWPEAHRNKKPGVPGWGRIAEAFVSPAVDRKLLREERKPVKFIAGKGDVLIWYARLIHRGSSPSQTNQARPAIIGHYAPIFERDRGLFVKSADSGYFILPRAKLEQLRW